MNEVLESVDQVPRELKQSLAQCTDAKMLKYFKNYE